MIIKWYMQYMQNRIALLDLKGTTTKKVLKRGTPQGGVLSPLMWNIVFDNLLTRFDRGPLNITGFADDAAIIASGPDLTSLIDIMTSGLRKAHKWSEESELKFSPTKSEAVIFSYKRIPKDPKPILLNDIPLPYRTSVRYLGVTLDNRLSWNQHIQNKCKRAKKRLMMLRNKLGKLWGPKPDITKWIWSGVIQPSITYASHVWLHATNKKSNQETFNRLQSLAMRLMGHFRPSTPTAGLQVALGLPPLTIEIQKIAINTHRRLILNNSLPTTWDGLGSGSRRGHIWRLSQLHQRWGLPNPLDDDRCELRKTNCKATLSEDSFIEGYDLLYDTKSWRVYTDGSRIENKTGCGYSIHDPKINDKIAHLSAHLGAETSVFQAEVEAINRAVQDIPNLSAPGDHINILCDSQSALRAIFKGESTSKTIIRCVTALNNLTERNGVTLNWIKAHVNYKGNELADKHAKAGAYKEEGSVTITLPDRCSKYDLLINEAAQKAWTEQWSQNKDCRQTKVFFSTVDLDKSQQITKLDRTKLSRLIRFTTGHNFLRYHNSNIDKNMPKSCRLCHKNKEDAVHIITDCEALWRIRWDSFYQPFLNTPVEWKVSQMIKFLQHHKVQDLENEQDQAGVPPGEV
jgi:ribonuclease HI